MGLDAVEFGQKFRAYEQAMQANNYFGLKGDLLGEQFGRYATGIQYDQTKAANKLLGRDVARQNLITEDMRQVSLERRALQQAQKAERLAFKGNTTVFDSATGKYVSTDVNTAKLLREANGKIITDEMRQASLERRALQQAQKAERLSFKGNTTVWNPVTKKYVSAEADVGNLFRKANEKIAGVASTKPAAETAGKTAKEVITKTKVLKGSKNWGVVACTLLVYGAMAGISYLSSKRNKTTPAPAVEGSQKPLPINPERTPAPVSPSPAPLPEEEKDNSYIIKSGDSFWSLAEKSLIKKYKEKQLAAGKTVNSNYRPSDDEIRKEAMRISELHGRRLKVGDKLEI